MTAMVAGGYVKLNNNVTLNETVEVTKDVTLDLNGHDIDFSGNTSRPFELKNGATLTIIGTDGVVKVGSFGLVNVPVGNDATIVLKGGVYEGNTNNGSFLKPRGEGRINITLENVAYTDNSSDGYILNTEAYTGEELKITITGGNFKAAGGIQLQGKGSSITGATITTTGNNGYKSVAVEVVEDATLENCTIASAGYAVTASSEATATVQNCNVTGVDAYYIFPTGGTINVTGGSYTGTARLHDPMNNGKTGKITVNNVVVAQ